MNNNKKVGNALEKEICEYLSQHGWWAHNFANNKNGQPCDIVAVSHNHPVLIDAKNCEGDYFNISRIEDNQDSCFKLYTKINDDKGGCYFAVKFEKTDNIYIAPYPYIKTHKRWSEAEMRSEFFTIEEWVDVYNDIFERKG